MEGAVRLVQANFAAAAHGLSELTVKVSLIDQRGFD
jgi:hypothetical protein